MKDITGKESAPKPEYGLREFCPYISGRCKKDMCVAWEPTDKRCTMARRF